MMLVGFREIYARLEELLATDELFVEYFNEFLALPTFPDPLFFNKDTGGFEILSDARKKMAEEIKAAVRSGRLRKRIYRAVHNNSFSVIPLVPMIQRPLVEDKEINTLFTVKTLNKEQGIGWVKEERLPMFLESECYVEYRLAKMISQTKSSGLLDNVTTFSLEFNPRAEQAEIDKEMERMDQIDTEKMMKNMFVSMGNATTTETEAWVSQAKTAQNAPTTSVSMYRPARPSSAVLPGGRTSRTRTYSSGLTPHGGTKQRPHSAVTESDTHVTDSGIWSRTDMESSLEGISMDTRDDTISDDYDRPLTNTPTPPAPRPSDRVCMVAERPHATLWSSGSRAVYASPLPEYDSNFGDELDDPASEMTLPDDDGETALTFSDQEELAAVVVGTVLKYALADIANMTPEQLESHHAVQEAYPHKRFTSCTIDNIEQINTPRTETPRVTQTATPKPIKSPVRFAIPDSDEEDEEETETAPVIQPKEPFTIQSPATPALSTGSRDSDEDSLLNSDDDYEGERDAFFTRHKKKRRYNLLKKRGIEEFKTFLINTRGETNWNLWIDIDRARLIKDENKLVIYLSALRERYHKKGAIYQLNDETLEQLHLVEPTQWTLSNLLRVQMKMVEPLVLYWAPRFLIKQEMNTKPNRNYIYNQQLKLKSVVTADHEPKTATLLPLRPKSCMPRLPAHRPQIEISGAFDDLPTVDLPAREAQSTTPKVGMRRSYQLLTSAAEKKLEKERKNQERRMRKKTPREIVSKQYNLQVQPPKRPGSAASAASSSGRRSSTGISLDLDSSYSGPSQATSTALNSARSTSSGGSSEYSQDSEMSNFYGGRRLEGLLQALNSERQSGDFFWRYLNKSDNVLWCNALMFWTHLQGYHKMFYTEIKDIYNLERKAQAINAQFVVDSAPASILCKPDLQEYVHEHLNPPYEELFDAVEEYALDVLYEAWSEMLMDDMTVFNKVQLTEVKRHLQTKSKYMLKLQRRGIIRERPSSPGDDPLAVYTDPVYDPLLLERIPEQFRHYTLYMLVHNRIELEHFRQFLSDNYASVDLTCWMDIETFKRIPHAEDNRRDQKAKDIKVKYLNKKYFFGPNSPAGKAAQEKVMTAGGGWGKLLEDRPPTASLLEAQKYVQERIEKKWLPQFLATQEFSSRQQPQSSLDDVVEDVMMQKKKRSQDLRKMLESEWVSASKDILTFRRALLNPSTSQNFRKYISAKGETLENDVLFWHEVQKYKEFCHQHCDRTLLQQKTLAIVNCFIDSPIPPTLQVDITQDMADDIVDRKMEVSPYLFREAQLTVFRVLFKYWKDFCTFRENLTDDKILPTIERHRREAMAQRQREQRREESRKKREIARKKAQGIRVTEDGDEVSDKGDGGDEYDPFAPNMDEFTMSDSKAVSWSYSKYMEALDGEEVLNEVDNNTFTDLSKISEEKSMTSTASHTGSVADDKRERKGSISNGTSEPRKLQQAPPQIQADLIPVTVGQPRIRSAKSSRGSSTSIGGGRLDSPGDASNNTSGVKENGNGRRMTRTMPPLVGKR